MDAGAPPPPQLTGEGRGYVFSFSAMASPCELRIDCDDVDVALAAGRLAEAEALRIERKFSRYRHDSVVGTINAGAGTPVEVDEETADLIDFAASCHALSGGLFDITSGVLRQAWRFDGSDRLPTQEAISALTGRVGWDRVEWRRPTLRLPAGMEVDFGGIGKEYAVDRALASVAKITGAAVLVNFGGDLCVSRARADGPWKVAIESVDEDGRAVGVIELSAGALATSGDARRFLLKDGVRYGHILDPRTGRPVPDTPRSVTVAAGSCVEAGMFATLAMLHGREAEAFLESQGVRAWCIR
jgi:thiamine biosynthesis lipoprotein